MRQLNGHSPSNRSSFVYVISEVDVAVVSVSEVVESVVDVIVDVVDVVVVLVEVKVVFRFFVSVVVFVGVVMVTNVIVESSTVLVVVEKDDELESSIEEMLVSSLAELS